MKQFKISIALLPIALMVVADMAEAQRRATRSAPRSSRSAPRPMRNAPVRSAPRPVRSAPRIQAPRRSAPIRRAPTRSTPTRTYTPTRRTPTRTRTYAPTRSTPTRTRTYTPTRSTRTRYTPSTRTRTRITPQRTTPNRYTPSRRTPVSSAPRRVGNTPSSRTPYRAPTRLARTTPVADRYRRPSTPVRVRYNTRPRSTTNSSISLRDMYRRVPSARPDSGTNYRSGGVRSDITARSGSRYSSDIRRRSTPTVGTRRPTVSERYTPERRVTPRSTSPRLRNGGRNGAGKSGRVPTVRTGGGGRNPRTNNRRPRINAGARRSVTRPRRAIRRHASNHYRYGSGRYRHNYYRHSVLGGLLGLGWCDYLGWNSWGYYAYDPYYSSYGLGYGYNNYHWSVRYCSPLNYSDWWYPSTYYPTSYIYINDNGDYSPYAATKVIGDDAAPEAAAPAAPEAAPVKADKPSTETVIKRHVTLGDFYFKEGRYSEASESYLRALAYAPEDASLHFVLADALFAIGDYHYAAFVIQKALRLDPAMAFAEADKREFYSDAREFDRQMATILAYVKEKPFDVAGQLVLGYNYKFSGQKDKALAAFKRVLEISPDNDAAKRFIQALTDAPAETDAGDSVKKAGRPPAKVPVKPIKKDR